MISIKTEKEIEIMREGGKLLAGITRKLEKQVKPGITTNKLEGLAQALILSSGAKCSFKGYTGPMGEKEKPFPACLCVSINEQIVHGIPGDQILKQGDIVSLDLGLFFKGFHSDMAITVGVGKIPPEAQRLIRITKKVLKLAIKKVRPGITFGDISNFIQRYSESQGFNIVRDLCGHGIGHNLHEEPQILNYGKRHSGPKIKQGMVFCLEPMLSIGDPRIKKSPDGFSWQTKDNSLSAHFEHAVAVTETGPKVLTNL